MKFKDIIISFVLGIIASLIAGRMQPYFDTNFLHLFIVGGTTFLIFLFFLHYLPMMKSYMRMYFIGRFRGLWSKDDLSILIQKEYEKSDEIKIKVTRGYGLFYENSGIFHKCIFDKKHNEMKIIKILLHYPCLKSDHIAKRASTNQKPKEAYVEDLFKVLKLFKDRHLNPNSNEKIFVKFYNSDDEKEWRFYVFKQESEDKVLLFNHYDENTTGSKSRMLKVIGGNNSLCEELNNEFDNLFDNYSVELVENLKASNKLINPNYCGHPGCNQKIIEIHKKVFT